MKDLFGVIFGGGLILGVVLLVFFIGPVLILWTLNSLAEAGGSTFYIEHNMWNYWVAFVLLLILRGGSSSSKSE